MIYSNIKRHGRNCRSYFFPFTKKKKKNILCQVNNSKNEKGQVILGDTKVATFCSYVNFLLM